MMWNEKIKVDKKYNKEDVLYEIFRRLDDRSISYVVIHGRERIRKGNISDVDVAFERDPKIALVPLLKEMQQQGYFRIINILHYDVPNCYYMILAIEGKKKIVEYLHIDCLCDETGINRYILKSSDLLRRRALDGDIYAPRPEIEGIYLLIKKTKKKTLDKDSASRVKDLMSKSPNESISESKRIVNGKFASIVKNLLQGKYDEDVNALYSDVSSSLKGWYYTHPFYGLRRGALQAFRLINRMRRPSGVFIVFLGPDGSGKSTIANEVLKILKGGFRKTWHFHWRPGILPSLGRKKRLSSNKNTTNAPVPSTTFKYGVGLSLARFFYYFADFALGSVKITLARMQTTLVVSERYYYDHFVHPERYAFKIPKWVFRIGLVAIRKPDLVIVLENDPRIIWERKKELPLEEITRQLDLYKKFAKSERGFCVRTDDSVDTISKNIAVEVLKICERKIVV